MAEGDFPEVETRHKNQPVWNTPDILDWITRHNIKVLMGQAKAAQYEQDLLDRKQVDPLLETRTGMSLEREKRARTLRQAGKSHET